MHSSLLSNVKAAYYFRTFAFACYWLQVRAIISLSVSRTWLRKRPPSGALLTIIRHTNISHVANSLPESVPLFHQVRSGGFRVALGIQITGWAWRRKVRKADGVTLSVVRDMVVKSSVRALGRDATGFALEPE